MFFDMNLKEASFACTIVNHQTIIYNLKYLNLFILKIKAIYPVKINNIALNQFFEVRSILCTKVNIDLNS